VNEFFWLSYLFNYLRAVLLLDYLVWLRRAVFRLIFVCAYGPVTGNLNREMEIAHLRKTLRRRRCVNRRAYRRDRLRILKTQQVVGGKANAVLVMILAFVIGQNFMLKSRVGRTRTSESEKLYVVFLAGLIARFGGSWKQFAHIVQADTVIGWMNGIGPQIHTVRCVVGILRARFRKKIAGKRAGRPRKGRDERGKEKP